MDKDDQEIVDQCTNCGQETEYRCTRLGNERVCEYCYEMTMEMLP